MSLLNLKCFKNRSAPWWSCCPRRSRSSRWSASSTGQIIPAQNRLEINRFAFNEIFDARKYENYLLTFPAYKEIWFKHSTFCLCGWIFLRQTNVYKFWWFVNWCQLFSALILGLWWSSCNTQKRTIIRTLQSKLRKTIFTSDFKDFFSLFLHRVSSTNFLN
jgi:hypothetical protein